MGEDLFVDVGELRGHAGKVRGLGVQAGVAVSAANQVAFDPAMFGKIGTVLVGPFMDPLQWAGVKSTEAVEGSLNSTAEIIDGLANGFEHIDNTIGKHVKAIDEAIR